MGQRNKLTPHNAIMFRLSLLALTFSTLVIFAAAAPAVDDVVSEETLIESIDESPKMSTSQLLKRTHKAMSETTVASLLATLTKMEPGNIKKLNGAIEKIIEDMIKSHKATQNLINKQVGTYATCAKLPLADKEANDNAAKKFLLIEPAQKELKDAGTGNIDYDFGKNPTESGIAASGVKTAVDAYMKVFNDAYNRQKKAQSNYDAAQQESDNADKAKKNANHECFCAAKKSYDDVVKDAMESNKNDKRNLKHFQMIQCVMAEFAKGNKETGAFKSCDGKSYDDKVVSLDYQKANTALSKDINCSGAGAKNKGK